MRKFSIARYILLSVAVLLVIPSSAVNAQVWTAKLDHTIRFSQTTEMGVLIVGTEKSLYAMDGSTGEILWRLKNVSLEETDVAAIPGSDLLLLSFEKGERTRLEAVDILTGNLIWKSEAIRGGVMQMAVDPAADLLAVVFAKNAKGHHDESFKRHPLLHVFNLSSGDELWHYEVNEVEMMPSRWPANKGGETDYTLDNYYSPAFVEGRLYVFYEGLTSFDALTGKARLRERYRVNEEGLALTEAAPIFDAGFIYTSGHGRVRAISRETGDTSWEAKDLGLTPEMMLVDDRLFVRMGGQFTRLKDGEIVERGPYGVSALDPRTGKVLWRYKGADKGITNLVLPDSSSIFIADHDDLIIIDSKTGKRRARVKHGIERPSFGILNEAGNVVVGGQSEISALDATSGRELWRARHTPPGRGIFRAVTAIAARAASLYFRYGGTTVTAFRGLQLARAAGNLGWSALVARSSVSNLQALATGAARKYAKSYAASRYRQFGLAARLRGGLPTGNVLAGNLTRDLARPRITDVEERLLDRLDPAAQLDRLSRFLWHRDRLAALRGQWMYFYTDLKGRDGNGLAGVNINNGETARQIRLRELDERFIPDEALGLMFVSAGNRMLGYSLLEAR